MRRLIFAIFSLLFFALAAPAGADGHVFVHPGVPHSSVLQAGLEARLRPGDDINVDVYPFGHVVVGVPEGIGVVAVGDVVSVHSSGWLPQAVADEIVARVEVVARTQQDRLFRVIREVHEWQGKNPKPAPPPPPPPPPGPPFDWGATWLLWLYGISGAIGVLGIIIRVQAWRRARKLAVLRRFEQDMKEYQ